MRPIGRPIESPSKSNSADNQREPAPPILLCSCVRVAGRDRTLAPPHLAKTFGWKTERPADT
jgi:hypothetical protein